MKQKKWLYIGAGFVALGLVFRKQILQTISGINNNTYLSALHPSHRAKFVQFLNHLEREGFEPSITSGHRTLEHQQQLYNVDSRNARPGYSYHNWGLAIDINTQSPKLRKATTRAEWLPVYYIAQSYGLKWGGDFNSYYDPVHFFVDPGFTTAQLLDRYNSGHITEGFVDIA